MQMMYEEFGATDEVKEYAYEVLQKARAIEYSLTGQVYDRLLRINRQLLRHHCVTAFKMNRIFNKGEFKPALLEWCGMKRLNNKSYISEDENMIIQKIMMYGEAENEA